MSEIDQVCQRIKSDVLRWQNEVWEKDEMTLKTKHFGQMVTNSTECRNVGLCGDTVKVVYVTRRCRSHNVIFLLVCSKSCQALSSNVVGSCTCNCEASREIMMSTEWPRKKTVLSLKAPWFCNRSPQNHAICTKMLSKDRCLPVNATFVSVV